MVFESSSKYENSTIDDEISIYYWWVFDVTDLYDDFKNHLHKIDWYVW